MTTFNEHLGNIFAVFARSDRRDKEWGMTAYECYQERIARIAAGRANIEVACGIFAALSPNVDEAKNFQGLERMLGGGHDSYISGYPLNKVKARRIMDGEHPLDVLSGLKTRSFYINLCYPERTDAVTIDMHMLSIWLMQRLKAHEASMAESLYKRIAGDYRQVASLLNLRPNQLQSICWTTWKRVHNIVYDKHQTELFV